MSCISKILELKGDNSFLMPNNRYSTMVECIKKYNGYYYLVSFARGYRCGTVEIPLDHPLNGLIINDGDYEEVSDILICEKGISYASRNTMLHYLVNASSNELLISFDCAHINDLSDINTHEKYGFTDSVFTASLDYMLTTITDSFSSRYASGSPKIRSLDYVETECKSIIDQLIQMESAHV